MSKSLYEMLAERTFAPAWAAMPAEVHTKLRLLSDTLADTLQHSAAEVRDEILVKVRTETLRHTVGPQVQGLVQLPVDPKLKAEALAELDVEQVTKDLEEVLRTGGIPLDQVIEEFERERRRAQSE